MLVKMLNVERRYRGMTRRTGVFDDLTSCLKAAQFESEEEAVQIRLEEENRSRESEGRKRSDKILAPQLELFAEDDVEDTGVEQVAS